MLDVYVVTPKSSFCGGCAIIAAKSANEAEILFRNSEYRNFIFDNYNCVIENNHNLVCKSDTSKLILDTIYVE